MKVLMFLSNATLVNFFLSIFSTCLVIGKALIVMSDF